jgi:hypothetical protein
MLGDLNMVEDVINRLPAHRDRPAETEVLDDLKSMLGLCNSWRQTFKHSRNLPFLSESNGALSRIDRIYTA